MTVTTTYMADLNRVRVAFSGAPAGTDYATIERSTDGINWTTVRGGAQVTPAVGHVDDYEFAPGVSNTYRATYVDVDLMPSLGAVGTAVTGNNTSLVPSAPAGLAAGDLKLIFASIRNSGTGAVGPAPSGWSKVAEFGNMALLGRIHVPGDTPPTVTFTGGVANADTLVQMARFPNAQLAVSSPPVSQLNGSAQNIAGPAVVLDGRGMLLYLCWKQDDLTSTTTPTFATKIGDVSSVAGDDASMAWFFFPVVASTAGVSFTQFPVAVTGGAAAISRAIAVQFPVIAYLSRETAAITPTFTKVWIKNLQRPYMNTALSTPVGELLIEREARAGVFPVKGRSLPIAVTDLRGGRAYTIGAQVVDAAERTRLNLILNAGEPILLHIPPGNIRLESMYAVIGKTSYDDEASIQWMPLTEVAAPAASIVGSTVTWQDIVSGYATWSDLIAAKATWAAVIDSVGDPTDIITG